MTAVPLTRPEGLDAVRTGADVKPMQDLRTAVGQAGQFLQRISQNTTETARFNSAARRQSVCTWPRCAVCASICLRDGERNRAPASLCGANIRRRDAPRGSQLRRLSAYCTTSAVAAYRLIAVRNGGWRGRIREIPEDRLRSSLCEATFRVKSRTSGPFKGDAEMAEVINETTVFPLIARRRNLLLRRKAPHCVAFDVLALEAMISDVPLVARNPSKKHTCPGTPRARCWTQDANGAARGFAKGWS